MARSDVVVTAAMIWATFAVWVWIRQGGFGWLVLQLACVVLALGSKEAGVIIAPVTTLFGVLALGLRGKRMLALLPVWLLTAAYLVSRALILGGDAATIKPSPPLHWVSGWAMYLVNALPFQLVSTVRNLSLLEIHAPGQLAWNALILAAATGLLLLGALRKDMVTISLLGWIMMALTVVLVPAAIHVPEADVKVPMADRWLYLALPGVALLWPWLLYTLKRRYIPPLLQAATLIWAAASITLAPGTHAYFSDELHQLEWEDLHYERTPPEARTSQDSCRKLDRRSVRYQLKGDPGRLLLSSKQAELECGQSHGRTFNIVSALVETGRFEEAAPLARQLLRRRGGDSRGTASEHYLAGVIAMKVGDPGRAMRLLERAIALGLSSCKVHEHLANCALALRRPDRAALAAEQAYRCTGGAAPVTLLTAAELWLAAGQPERARGLLARLKAIRPMTSAFQARLREIESQLAR